MFCVKCGNKLPDGSQSCPNCGTVFTAAEIAASRPAQNSYTPPKAEGKKSRGGIIALILILAACLGLLLLLIVGVVLIFGLKWGWGKDNGDGMINDGSAIVGSVDGDLAGNIYEAVYEKYADFVLPGSDSSFKCYRDIDGMTEQELTVAEQEIYARHGNSFSDGDLQAYFAARSWYPAGAESFTPNIYEQANLDLIRIYRAKQDGSLYRTGNKYINAVSSNLDYVIRQSSTQLLTGDEVEGFSREQLCVARNEILARQGWLFDDEDLREYFYSKPWYMPSIPAAEFDYDSLSTVEQNNISLIRYYEEHDGGYVEWSANNPYREVYYKYWDRNYIFSYSSTRRLEKSQFDGMTEYELTIARNEIYARNGYTFKSHNLMEYFQHHAWYTPTTQVGAYMSFNSIEDYNIDLIQEAEREASKNSDLTYHHNGGGSDWSSLDTTLGYSASCDAFAVKLPNYWKEYVVIENYGHDDCIYFHDKISQDAGYEGLLFGFEMFIEGEDYTYYPAYRELGTLTSPDGKIYHLIVYYPTDMQCSEGNRDFYYYMREEEKNIFATITAQDGWTFTPA